MHSGACLTLLELIALPRRSTGNITHVTLDLREVFVSQDGIVSDRIPFTGEMAIVQASSVQAQTVK